MLNIVNGGVVVVVFATAVVSIGCHFCLNSCCVCGWLGFSAISSLDYISVNCNGQRKGDECEDFLKF